MLKRLIAVTASGALFLSSYAQAADRAHEQLETSRLTMSSVGPTEKWETFRNNKNHFEFKKPACMGFHNSDYENEPQDSNVVSIITEGKCGQGFGSGATFSSLDTKPFNLDRILSVKAGLITRELLLNGTRAVMTAKRVDKKGCSRWTVYSICNGRNLSIDFVQCMGEKEFKALEKGIGEPDPVTKAIVESYKCLIK